jgi:hypothetical protein
MSTTPALQLDSSAYGKAKGLRRGEDIVDSLAYIDDITPDEQRIAENLIKEEVNFESNFIAQAFLQYMSWLCYDIIPRLTMLLTFYTPPMQLYLHFRRLKG